MTTHFLAQFYLAVKKFGSSAEPGDAWQIHGYAPDYTCLQQWLYFYIFHLPLPIFWAASVHFQPILVILFDHASDSVV